MYISMYVFLCLYQGTTADELCSVDRYQGWGQRRICICVFVFESSVFVFDFLRFLIRFLFAQSLPGEFNKNNEIDYIYFLQNNII